VVTLRRWAAGDADWYAATVRDPLIQRFTCEVPDLSADTVRTAIEALHANPDRQAGYLIADATTGERLGNIALAYHDGVGEVSYWLAPAARGRGAATRALVLLSAWAFSTLPVAELRLWTHADNTASQRVAERAGYHHDPERDGVWEVKDELWPSTAYALPAPED
jgi:RimJ/RimL family protein N-acetyltransferase